ncbi:MAG: hypothetical protein ACPG4U_04585 [Pseudomonadales bacterium]
MSIVVFTDIDDTLIQTERKCPQGEPLAVTAVDKQGAPASFSTPAQQCFFDWSAAQHLIPVTGRNKQALDRVALNFTSYKVIDHGAIVLDQNDLPDPQWMDAIRAQSERWQGILQDYLARVAQQIETQKLSLRCRIISDYEVPCYISIKGEPGDLLKLKTLGEDFAALEDNARVHVNGNNMALLAPYSCKKRAVEFIQQRLVERERAVLFIGAGDSSSDLPFMQACHFQVIPSTSQITREQLQ